MHFQGYITRSGTKVTRRTKGTEIEEGSGNIFADIGLPNPEEALAKAQIARQVNRILRDRGLSQVEAGRIPGIRQPRVSDLVRGRLTRFSLEKLLDFAARVGINGFWRAHPPPDLRKLSG